MKKYEDILWALECCSHKKDSIEEHGDKDEFFNVYMSAGENAFKVLGIENGQEVPEGWV